MAETVKAFILGGYIYFSMQNCGAKTYGKEYKATDPQKDRFLSSYTLAAPKIMAESVMSMNSANEKN